MKAQCSYFLATERLVACRAVQYRLLASLATRAWNSELALCALRPTLALISVRDLGAVAFGKLMTLQAGSPFDVSNPALQHLDFGDQLIWRTI
jgi:hypothetical protein